MCIRDRLLGMLLNCELSFKWCRFFVKDDLLEHLNLKLFISKYLHNKRKYQQSEGAFRILKYIWQVLATGAIGDHSEALILEKFHCREKLLRVSQMRQTQFAF